MHTYSKLATDASARTAIQQYRRQSHDVDDKNPEHVAAYMLLRDSYKRISGRMLEDYLKSKKQTIGSGDRSTMDVWAVPRGNFPTGLPPHIANAERPVGTMSHQYSPDDFYFIDQVIPRTELGMSVITTGTYVQSSTTGTLANAGRPVAEDASAALPQASQACARMASSTTAPLRIGVFGGSGTCSLPCSSSAVTPRHLVSTAPFQPSCTHAHYPRRATFATTPASGRSDLTIT